MTPKRVSADRPGADPRQSALQDFMRGIELLEQVATLSPTMERESMCASAYKRLAMIEVAMGRPKEERDALTRAQEHYSRAERLGRERNLGGVVYPQLNRLAAELVLNVGRDEWKGLDPDAKSLTRAGLEEATRSNPDFRSFVGLVELQMYEALESRTLAAVLPAIVTAYQEIRQRVRAPGYWQSVYDQLRFVLPSYAAGAPEPERNAVLSLLELLEKFTK